MKCAPNHIRLSTFHKVSIYNSKCEENLITVAKGVSKSDILMKVCKFRNTSCPLDVDVERSKRSQTLIAVSVPNNCQERRTSASL
ncbi:hypothetical protein ACTXT7_004454 [Hymenolepis weldensis]